MARKAVITIIGKQRYGDERDEIEVTTVGTIEEKADEYTIRYVEEQESLQKPIKTSLHISKDEQQVEMLKSGPYSSCLVIERSKRNLCNYGTEYGNMLMGIYGRSVQASYGKNEGSFSFEYDIDFNGALASQNEVIINYRITQ